MPASSPASAKASEPATPPTVASLIEKGDGVMMKRNGVWTYPSCPNDRSGTNLVLPTEFVSEAAVQDAIAKGEIVATAVDGMGSATSIARSGGQDGRPRFVNLMQAGSVEAATELPPNSRPTHDAGRAEREVDVAVAQGAGTTSKAALPAGSVVPPTGPGPAAPAAAVAKP